MISIKITPSHFISSFDINYPCFFVDEFQTRVTCEGEEMILKCQKNKRIAVLSAMFGRSDKDYMECPAQKRVGRSKMANLFNFKSVCLVQCNFVIKLRRFISNHKKILTIVRICMVVAMLPPSPPNPTRQRGPQWNFINVSH